MFSIIIDNSNPVYPIISAPGALGGVVETLTPDGNEWESRIGVDSTDPANPKIKVLDKLESIIIYGNTTVVQPITGWHTDIGDVALTQYSVLTGESLSHTSLDGTVNILKTGSYTASVTLRIRNYDIGVGTYAAVLVRAPSGSSVGSFVGAYCSHTLPPGHYHTFFITRTLECNVGDRLYCGYYNNMSANINIENSGRGDLAVHRRC